MSTSSTSSQASSSGRSWTPPTPSGSQGTPECYPDSQVYGFLETIPAMIDVTTGVVVSPSTLAGYTVNPPPGRFHRFFHINNPVPYPVHDSTQATHRLSHGVPVEHRKIIIRELSLSVNEQTLQQLLRSRSLRGECTIEKKSSPPRCHAFVQFFTNQGAVEAVRKLDGWQFLGRRLKVEIARETSVVNEEGRGSSNGVSNHGSEVSSNPETTPSNRRRRWGPIIADGSS